MSSNTNNKLLENPVLIFFALFFFLFILALPLLWKSPRFSKIEKIIFTVFSLLETTFVFNKISFILTVYLTRFLEMSDAIDKVLN